VARARAEGVLRRGGHRGRGHGLSTAYYLAKNHGITNVAVLEKGALGRGNVGRNTTIVRANYFPAGNSEFYSHSLKLWEGLERELNYNVMHSQRGHMILFHSDGQRDAAVRRGNAMLAQGDDAVLYDREGVRAMLPYLDFEQQRFPIHGGLFHPRGGTARHDAVAWGYARGADRRGVDLIQNCEVTGIDIEGGVVRGVRTTRGAIRAKKVAIVVAGRSSQVAALAGMRLPIESHVLQAFVTEGLKPVIDHVVSFGMGHFYISQSDKGGLVFGGDLDFYASYAARGNLPMVEHVMEAGMTLMPMIGARARAARLGRHHGHVARRLAHHRPDAFEGLFLNCGWNYGGFKAVPGLGLVPRALMATGQPHEAARASGSTASHGARASWTRRGRVRSTAFTSPALALAPVLAAAQGRPRAATRALLGGAPGLPVRAGVARLSLRIDGPLDAAGTSGELVSVLADQGRAREAGLGQGGADPALFCERRAGLVCGVDCDGGLARLDVAPDGALLLTTDYLMVGGACGGAASTSWSAWART
jgi:sarcosine oxidase subunit beta